MAEETAGDQNIQASEDSVTVGNVSVGESIDGSLIIGSHNVVGLTSDQVSTLITQISTTFQPKPFDGRSPYKGLDFFEEEDAELFFGREKLVQDLVGRVKDSRTVFITGPSGSGKSSLVRAGVIHALKQGTIPNSERWLYATMKPGREPIQTLAGAVAGLVMSTNAEDEIRAKALIDESIFARWCEIALKDGRDKRLVLFIDQFEEIFTQISKEEERVVFLNLLTHAARMENGRVIILFSMRSDFVPNCATYPKLNALLNQQFVQIGAMQGDELVSAIAQPALRVGLRIDPDLIAQIINDMQGEPGALPLMQFALKDLFEAEQAKGGLIALTLKDYLERGGIHKALERHANDSFNKLSEQERELARSIFKGLIEIGRGTQDTRRTAIFDELVPASAGAEEVEVVVGKLADARLITTDEIGGKDTVTISHEKLIDAWPWLKKLVNENRDVIALQNEIAEDAKEWEEKKRDASYLYSGARLVNANEQLKSNKLMLSGTALEYIRAGQARQRRSRSAMISAVSVMIALLLLAVIVFSNQSTKNAQLAQDNANIANTAQAAGTEAVKQRNDAELQKRIALARQLAAQAISKLDTQYDLAALLSVEAVNQPDTPEARSALMMGFQTHSNLIGYLQGHHSPIVALVFSPKQNILASASKDGQIILWDVTKRIPLYKTLTVERPITSLFFSPDGQVLVAEMIANAEVDVQWKEWNVLNPADSTTTSLIPAWCGDQCPGNVYRFQPAQISDLAASPDGKTLVESHTDKTLTFWDISETPDWNNADSDYSNNQQLTISWYTFMNRVAWSADSKIVTSGDEDGHILLWSPPSFTLHQSAAGNNLAWGIDVYRYNIVDWTLAKKDGLGFAFTKATQGLDSDPKFETNWNALKQLGIPRGVYDLFVIDQDPKKQALFFANQVTFLPGDLPPVLDLELIRNAKDKTNEDLLVDINTWMTEVERKMGRRPILYNAQTLLQESTRDRTGKYPGWLTNMPLWLAQYPPNPNTPSHRYEDPHAGPTGYSVKLPGDWPNDWSFWQFTEKGLVKGVEIDGRPTPIDISYYNGSSTNLASALKQVPFPSRPIGNPTLDLNSEIIAEPLTGQPGPINSLSYSENGKWLASASADGKLILWDMEKKSDPIILQQGGIVIHSVSISPDEHWLATGNGDGTVQLWNLETRKLRATLNGIPNRVLSVAFDKNSKLIAASGCAEYSEGQCKFGQITIWKVADLKASNLIGHSDAINSLAFSPDNKLLASGSEDGTIIFWKTADWTKSDPVRDRPSGVLTLTFSHNGKWLASAGMDGTVSIWDVSKLPLSATSFKGHTLPVFALAFNKDDSLLASGSWDKTIIIWDVKSHQQVGNPLRGHSDYISSLAFSPDGKTLVSGGWDNTIVLWNLDLQSWIKKACQIAGRNFTRAEWQQYFPGTTYPSKQEDATCPEWPLEPEIKVTPTATP